MAARKFGFFFFFLLPAVVWGQGAPQKIVFKVYSSDKPTVMYDQFRPILDQAQNFLKSQGQDVQIDLAITPDYKQTIDDLVSGKADMGRVGPSSYVTIKDQVPDISIVAMELVDGKKEFDGFIITRKTSPVQSVKDLRGKSFAFGDPLSTLGRYLPQAVLVRAGIHAKDLAKFNFLDRHDKVAGAVLNGDFDAGSVKAQTFAKFEKQGEGLRMVATLKNVTKPWVARKGLSPQIIEGMRKFLLQLKDPVVLKTLDDSSGFTMGSDHDYAPIREAMNVASSF